MGKVPPYERVGFDVTADVALFTLNQGELSVVVEQQDEASLWLLTKRLDDHTSLLETATQAVQAVVEMAETEPPLEPYVWQVVTEYDPGNLRIRIGHAAVAGELTFSTSDRPPAVLPVNEAALRLPPEETMIMQAAAVSLRRAAAPYHYHPADTWAETGPVIARLLRDPLHFTRPQLRAVFEAASGKKLAQTTFDFNIRFMFPGLVDTGDKARRKGRSPGKPATIYAMRPQHYTLTRQQHVAM
jgi:hypothetical protein